MSPICIVLLIVTVASAAPKKCGNHAKWSKCAPKCRPSCEAINNPGGPICLPGCEPGCKCNQGYILKKRYNICVKPENCDIIIN